jgi:uncharacterized repeat protein (TIGR01451 family)
LRKEIYMSRILEITKSKIAKTAGLALVSALAFSFIGISHADTFHNLTVNVSDACGPVVAQATIVNGPDDGAFGITNSNGSFTFNLHAGVFYVHISAPGHVSQDTGAVVLTGDQTLNINLQRTEACPGDTTPTPVGMHNLTVNVSDACAGPLVAQATIVNGPDDGAFGITNSNGTFTFNLHPGVFYVHFSASGFHSKDSAAVVLTGNQSLNMVMDRINGCPSTPPPPAPVPTPTPTPAPAPVTCPGLVTSSQPTSFTEMSGTREILAHEVGSGVTAVHFATWSEVDGQDDIVWYAGVNQGNGTWKSVINLAAHPGLGRIATHVYINPGTIFCTDFIWTRTAPTPPPPAPTPVPPAPVTCPGSVTSPQSTSFTDTTGTREIFAHEVGSGVTAVHFATWSEVNGQDDIVWYPSVNQGNGTWKATIDLARHPGLGNIATHVYILPGTTFCTAFNMTRTAQPTPPPPPACPNGTIVVTSNKSNAAYYITRPDGVTLGWNGSHTFENQPAGNYTIRVDEVTGFTKAVTGLPGTLAGCGSLGVNITYTQVTLPPPPPAPTPVTCTPGTQAVTVNQTANFSASGATGNFTWRANEGNPSSGTGSTFSTKFSTPGNYVVTATSSNNSSASCAVVVSPIAGSNVNLILSKRAHNQTQNVDATSTSAKPGDVIVYTLSVRNSGNAPANSFTFQDDLSDVLQLSMLQDFGGASFTLSTLTLSWPAVSVPANSTVEKTFTVKVNSTFPANSDNVMTNVFGNTLNVRVIKPTVSGTFHAPNTGAGTNVAIASVLSLLTLGGYMGYRKFKSNQLAQGV